MAHWVVAHEPGPLHHKTTVHVTVCYNSFGQSTKPRCFSMIKSPFPLWQRKGSSPLMKCHIFKYLHKALPVVLQSGDNNVFSSLLIWALKMSMLSETSGRTGQPERPPEITQLYTGDQFSHHLLRQTPEIWGDYGLIYRYPKSPRLLVNSLYNLWYMVLNLTHN